MAFTHVKNLYEEELYSAVNQLVTVILSDPTQCSSLPADQYFLTLCYSGNSLYEDHQFERASDVLKNALLARKTFMKLKANLSSYDSSVNFFSEAELRYKLALCYKAAKRIPEAIEALQIIALKNRSAKVNLLLFKLMQTNGQQLDKAGIVPLKALLKASPMNLEAISGLLRLGVKPNDIHPWIGDNLPPTLKEWIHNFIDGQSKMHSCQFLAAIESFKAIESNNEMVLVLIGQCYHYVGNSEAAATYLFRAYQMNNYLNDGLITLAAVYGNLNRLDDLEKLTPSNLTGLTDSSPEYWFILAQYLYCHGKYEEALYFSQKSYNLKPNNPDSAILKTKIFFQLKKYKEALSYLRVLEEFASYRFEIYELYVDVYLATNRFREAQEISRRMFSKQGSHLYARSYVLAAKTYFSQADPLIKIKSKPLLENALDKDPYCLPAVLMMVDLLLERGENSAAVKLIKKQCTTRPNSKLYAILGDILSKEKNHMKAVENYTNSIKIDPLNRRANTGLMALGSLGQSSNDETEQSRTYEFEEMLEVPGNAEAESESDAPWSDFEIETR
ncbi:anaphase-promoting complex subunit 7 [Bradysia coprophila]|uniref:anaphase-promoting complex subunit 7 n=1 Tax=Bradysia coprophila TaxID=38358 RepID=UPI00187DC682|nr:anaphase-promoting complex subunit 7 [Bradysia coprophila]